METRCEHCIPVCSLFPHYLEQRLLGMVLIGPTCMSNNGGLVFTESKLNMNANYVQCGFTYFHFQCALCIVLDVEYLISILVVITTSLTFNKNSKIK